MNINQEEFKLLRKLGNDPKKNQRELADELNVSLGKLNYVLKELKKGLVKKLKILIEAKTSLSIYTYSRLKKVLLREQK